MLGNVCSSKLFAQIFSRRERVARERGDGEVGIELTNEHDALTHSYLTPVFSNQISLVPTWLGAVSSECAAGTFRSLYNAR